MQPVPEGYDPLNFVGFTDRGIYSPDETYIRNDIVHKDNTVWRCLTDDTAGIAPSLENEHWEVFIAASNDSSGITATDTQGILGDKGAKVNEQDLIDAIADRVINRLLDKAQMSGVQVNDENRIPTSALLYRMNNEISESLDELNGNLSKAFSSRTIPDNDVNQCLENGAYLIGHNVTNAPTGYGVLIVFRCGAYVLQIVKSAVTVDGMLYVRTCDIATSGKQWSVWRHVALSST